MRGNEAGLSARLRKIAALVVNRRSGEEFARPHCDAFVLRVAIDVQAKFLGP